MLVLSKKRLTSLFSNFSEPTFVFPPLFFHQDLTLELKQFSKMYGILGVLNEVLKFQMPLII